MHRPFRKPLIVMSPKSLLRHARAVSSLSDLTDGAFRTVLDDPRVSDPTAVERVLMCSGRIYYALDLGREERARNNIAIVRLEQLYPFPEAELTEILKRYPRAGEFCWVQEEPANQGARDFVELRIERLLPGRRRLAYVGRGEAASPATGSHKIHQTEENDIVEAALRRPRPARAKR
jgi:2-oxoglutarate dehydrogenase E1 component